MLQPYLSFQARAPFFPLTGTVALLAVSLLLWKRPRAARLLGLTALALLFVFGSRPVSSSLAHSLEDRYPDTGIEGAPQAQAIVVLGGTIHMPGYHHPGTGLINSSDRMLHTLRLYRAGKAPLVLCSGGGEDGQPEASAMAALLEEWGVPREAILIEGQSLNTRQNAVFSYALLQARGIRHILLVTSAMHMPRSAAVFRKAGFEVSASPSDFRTGWNGPGGFPSPLDWFPDATDLMWTDHALREWVGLLIYRFRGWV